MPRAIEGLNDYLQTELNHAAGHLELWIKGKHLTLLSAEIKKLAMHLLGQAHELDSKTLPADPKASGVAEPAPVAPVTTLAHVAPLGAPAAAAPEVPHVSV